MALEQHRFSDAEAHARTAIELLRRHHFTIPEAGAHAALALSLLNRGKLDEARTAIEDGQKAVPAGEHYGLDLAIAAARVRAASGTASDREAAATLLEDAIARATAAGFAHHAVEARIAQAEIHLRQGDSAAISALAVLEKEARTRGYLLLAKRASEIH